MSKKKREQKGKNVFLANYSNGKRDNSTFWYRTRWKPASCWNGCGLVRTVRVAITHKNVKRAREKGSGRRVWSREKCFSETLESERKRSACELRWPSRCTCLSGNVLFVLPEPQSNTTHRKSKHVQRGSRSSFASGKRRKKLRPYIKW